MTEPIRHPQNSAIPDAVLYPPTVVPSDQELPLGRFLLRFVQNPLRALPADVYSKDLVVYQPAGGAGAVWITEPSLTEQILADRSGLFIKTRLEERVFERLIGKGVLTSDGQDWLWQRRTLAPLFRHSEILSYVPRMSEAAAGQTIAWARAGKGLRDIEADVIDTTFRVIATTMLAGGEPREGRTLKRQGAAYLARVPWEMAAELLRLPRWVPHPGTPGLFLAARRMRNAVREIVRRRQATQGGPLADGDLLGRLLAARHPETGAPMPNSLLIDNVLTLLEAGHETTARALTWTLYLLARQPGWQQRVRDEVKAVADTEPIGPGHIDRLAVTERVLKEAMRLYPPAPVIARRATAPVELGGQTVMPDMEIVIPIFAIHRHTALWRDPGRFDPDRFLPDAEARIRRTQYMPFGGGPRICLGLSFAMVEAKALLATFVRAAAFRWDGRHLPEPLSRVTLRPSGGMPLIVEPMSPVQ